MKKIWFWAMPILMCVCFWTYGCGCNSTIIRFDSEPTINLVLNSLNNETTIVKLVSNIDLENIDISYNKSIINYDAQSGKIIAVGEGQTFLKAKADGTQASVEVNVAKNNFVTGFSINQSASYMIRNLNNAPFDLLSALKNSYPSLNKYNMGYTFSTTGDCLTVDEKSGEVTPLSEGTQEVEIKVVKGISNGEYYYDTQRIKINVKKPCSTLSLAIYEVIERNDSKIASEVDFVESSGIKTYRLESDKWYILYSITDGNISGLVNYFVNYFVDESNNNLGMNSCIENYQVEDEYDQFVAHGSTVAKLAFVPKTSFYLYRQYKDEAALNNTSQVLTSNTIKVIYTDSQTPITCNFEDKPSTFITGHDGEDVLFSENENISFKVNWENLSEIELSCEPENGINCSFDNTTGMVTITPNGEYLNKLYTITVKNKNSTNEKQNFVYKFRLIESFEGNFVDVVQGENSVTELQIHEQENLQFDLIEKYVSGFAYALMVYTIENGEQLTLEDVNAIFDYGITSNGGKFNVNLNLKSDVGTFDETYYIKFVAKDDDGNIINTDELCSALITLNVVKGVQNGE